MSISKAVIMGKVVRNPEKRYTTNNIAVTSFAIDISDNEQPAIVRIVTKGKLAEKTVDIVKKDTMVIVEGKLQTNVSKNTDGTEKKGVEIDATAVENLTSLPGSQVKTSKESSIIDDDINNEDLIGEDEIPF